jgi:hypothetical protein
MNSLDDNNESLVLYTVHKAASMLLFKTLYAYAYKHDVSLYSSNSDDPAFRLEKILQNNFVSHRNFAVQPCLVGPVRRPANFINLGPHRKIIHLRDPRDVLTSMFFSFTLSHKGIDKAKSKIFRDLGVDNFVITRMVDMRERYLIYCRWIQEDPTIHLSTYESMYDDFAGWANWMFHVLGAEDRALASDLAQTEDPRIIVARGENAKLHKRKAEPGDFAEKLAPDTIAKLDESFAFYFELIASVRI